VAWVVALLFDWVGTDRLVDWEDTTGSDYAEVLHLVARVDSARPILMVEAVVEELDPSYELNSKDIRR